MKSKKYAEQLLDRLCELDSQTTAAYYDMGQILYSISQGKLFEVLGYPSMHALIEEELSYSFSTASKYLHTYRHFRRLKYNKTESLHMLRKFSFTHLAAVLPKINDKIGERAMQNRIDSLDVHQINFALSKSDYEECQRALHIMGAVDSESGDRLLHSSKAFMDMIREVLARYNGKAA